MNIKLITQSNLIYIEDIILFAAGLIGLQIT